MYTLSQIPLAKPFPISPFTIFASRASGYPLLQKPHFQIMPIYNSFIIFLVGFLPLVGEFLPQTPNKNRRENLKIFSPSDATVAKKISRTVKPYGIKNRFNSDFQQTVLQLGQSVSLFQGQIFLPQGQVRPSYILYLSFLQDCVQY